MYTTLSLSVPFIIVVYNVLPGSNSLLQLDAGWKLSNLRKMQAILVKNQLKGGHKPGGVG